VHVDVAQQLVNQAPHRGLLAYARAAFELDARQQVVVLHMHRFWQVGSTVFFYYSDAHWFVAGSNCWPGGHTTDTTALQLPPIVAGAVAVIAPLPACCAQNANRFAGHEVAKLGLYAAAALPEPDEHWIM
jgi:hypothetical protein